MTDDLMLRVPFVHMLGPVLEERRAGYARMVIGTGPRHAAHDGNLHGGVLTTLMDSTLAIALRELRGEGATTLHSSVEMNATFLSPVVPGDRIVIEGNITHAGPAVAFGEATAVSSKTSEPVAQASVTFAIQQEKA
jgi:uncharacterized protein (TIGR00369 family)